MQAAVDAGEVKPAFLYEGDFEGGTLRLWTGEGSLTMSGQVWTGAGHLLGVSAIGESLDVRADGLQLTLSGMPSSLISTVLASARYGKPGKLYLACMTNSGTVITDPYLTFSGKFDQPEINDSGETCMISVRYENSLVDLQRVRVRHYTHEDQVFEYPGDLGFEYVATLQDKQITWGR
jgi:hypothetical protein